MSIYKGAGSLIAATYRVYEDGELQSETDVTKDAAWSTGNSKTATVEKGYITFEEIIAYIEQYLGRHGLDK